ncbi:MAG TPA: LOG family protein, partial [Bdellovibrionales bacterium]|nr:LOG family protein [Bdellovibrionales bacterium]
ELTEALTLIQTGKLHRFPVVLMGTDYWKGFLDWLRETMVKSGTIDASDLSWVHVTDDPVEMMRIIKLTSDVRDRHHPPKQKIL